MQRVFLFCFILLTSLCKAQTNSIVLTSYVNENKIHLRWAPKDVNLFELAIRNGYTLEKIDLKGLPNFNINEFAQTKKEVFIFSSIIPKIDSLKKVKSKDERNYVLIEPFISPKGEIKSKKAAFAYALINAGYNSTLASNFNLSYIEKIKSKIAYQISITGTNHKSEIIIADATINSLNKAIKLEEGGQYKKSAVFSWEAKSLETDFSAYYIVRSDDGKNFKKLSDLPTLFLTSQYEKNKTLCSYADETVEHGKKYYYRIQGINHFAIETSKSNIIEIYIKNKFEPFVEIDTIKCKGKNKLIFPQLTFANETEKKCCASLVLMQSKNPTKNFKPIVASSPPEINKFNFVDSAARNYVHYKIGAISIDNDTVFSSPYYFFFNDSIAPKIPSEVRGSIDKKGILTLTWKKNTETDLKGYKIYYANTLKEEFVEKTKSFCKPNAFTDTISLNNLDSLIYYKVVAVDSNFNHSKPSAPIKLVKPDQIAPVSPIFTLVNSTKKGILLKWNNSTSADLKFTRLFRIEYGKELLIKQFLNADTNSFYLDTLIQPQTSYQYKLMASDKSGNTSFTKSNYQIYEPGFRKALKNFTAIPNIIKKEIALKWDSPTDKVFSYRIYRAKNNEAFILLKTIDAKNNFFNDKELNQNNNYSYKIQAILVSGVKTEMSPTIQAIY